MKRRRPDWRLELAKRPSKRQLAALDALHRGSMPQIPANSEPAGNFFDELEPDDQHRC